MDNNQLTVKEKKKNYTWVFVLAVILVIAAIIAAGAIYAPKAERNNTYQSMLRYYDAGDYSSAKELLEKLPEDYKEVAVYKQQIKQIENYYFLGVDAIRKGDVTSALNNFFKLPETEESKEMLTDEKVITAISTLVSNNWVASDGTGGKYYSTFSVGYNSWGKIKITNKEKEKYDGEDMGTYSDSLELTEQDIRGLMFYCSQRDSFQILYDNVGQNKFTRNTEYVDLTYFWDK